MKILNDQTAQTRMFVQRLVQEMVNKKLSRWFSTFRGVYELDSAPLLTEGFVRSCCVTRSKRVSHDEFLVPQVVVSTCSNCALYGSASTDLVGNVLEESCDVKGKE